METTTQKVAISAAELYEELRGLASSDEMHRLFSFAFGNDNKFEERLEGKWFAYNPKVIEGTVGPFSSQEACNAHC